MIWSLTIAATDSPIFSGAAGAGVAAGGALAGWLSAIARAGLADMVSVNRATPRAALVQTLGTRIIGRHIPWCSAGAAGVVSGYREVRPMWRGLGVWRPSPRDPAVR